MDRKQNAELSAEMLVDVKRFSAENFIARDEISAAKSFSGTQASWGITQTQEFSDNNSAAKAELPLSHKPEPLFVRRS